MYLTALKSYVTLYFIISLQEDENRRSIDIVRLAIEGGVTMVQLREKKAPLRNIIEEGGAIRELCRKHRVPFIVNDRVDIAQLLDADGVHVGQDDLPCAAARKLLGPNKIIGVSAGNSSEARAAISSGANYLGIGAIFATSTKGDAGDPIGTGLINEMAQESSIPIVGIGGIQISNAMEVRKAGADGIAVISAITRHIDPRMAAQSLLQAMKLQK